ncbi:hypothetical protein ACFL2J_02635 [Candidatus Omnitrophota bacterium]
MRKIIILFILIFSLTSCSAQENTQSQSSQQVQETEQAQEVEQVQEVEQIPKEELAGELFGFPVPMGNYYFAMRVATMFGTPWGGMPRTTEKLEERTWDDLLLSYEAFRRNITVTDEELETEIGKNLKGYKVEFDWEQDKEAYEEWAQDTLNEPTGVFENQMRHLVQLKKLQQEVLDSIEPVVTEEEALQEFLNEHNTLSIELVQFDELEDAQVFYEKVKDDPEAWEKEKEADPDSFKRPGFVALEFLMHMWKLEYKAVYDMIEMEVGSIYPPSPIYKGHGVFKVLEIRLANEEDFPKRIESYYSQLKHRKKYEGFYEWLGNLRKQADIKKYAKPPEGLFKEANP